MEDGVIASIAGDNTVLLTRVGSTVYGVTVDDQDDDDQLGICVEPPEWVIGLDRFEQWEHRTQPTGVRSGPGDLDVTIYSLRKWLRLAAAGNPSILVPLFVPVTDVVYATAVGVDLRLRPELVVSRRAGYKFLGYLRSQRAKLLGERGNATNRPELIERYGFDTKFAYHMVRLGFQGVELLETGRLTLPMAEPWRAWLRELRVGQHTRDEAVDVALDLEAQLDKLVRVTSPLPLDPDHDALNAFLVDTYREHWSRRESEMNDGSG